MAPARQAPDEQLLARVAAGDDLALGELYDRFGGVAYGLARRIVRDDELARDIVQEAFLTVWRQAGSYLPERGKVAGWLLTIVHRRSVDVVRREERRRTAPLASAPEPETAGADVEAVLKQERATVLAALERLPAPQREALELAYYGGFTQTQLAERLGEPVGTIKSRMFTGLRRLRELLDEDVQPTARERWRRRTTSTS